MDADVSSTITTAASLVVTVCWVCTCKVISKLSLPVCVMFLLTV